MTAYTSIQLSHKTKERLANMKMAASETYDELINALLDVVPSGDDEGQYTEEFKASLLRSLSDVKHGKTYTLKEVESALGL
jgi:DNA-binding TFAR19-related protein (PDSD5 family)